MNNEECNCRRIGMCSSKACIQHLAVNLWLVHNLAIAKGSMIPSHLEGERGMQVVGKRNNLYPAAETTPARYASLEAASSGSVRTSHFPLWISKKPANNIDLGMSGEIS